MTTTADILIETLIDWKVDTIFGLTGDDINGILEALRTRQDRIRFIRIGHVEPSALMAGAYAKRIGKLGICLVTSRPSGTHLLTALYGAKFDQAPVLAITGMQFHDLIETFTQQDIDLTRAFSDGAIFNAQVSDAENIEGVGSLACRSALAKRGVAPLTVANDVQEQALDEADRSKRNKPAHPPDQWLKGSELPGQGQVEKATKILNGAQKVAILGGRGALGARQALEETADLLAAPVAKALLGKAALPPTTGELGILGPLPSQEAMEKCDSVLIVGSPFPYTEYYPKPGHARGVQMDTNAQCIGLRYPVETRMVGDAVASLKMPNDRLRRKEDRSIPKHAHRGMRRWREMMAQAEPRPTRRLSRSS